MAVAVSGPFTFANPLREASAQEPAAPAASPATATFTLSGVVTSESDGSPQIGASVSVDKIGAVLTDERGAYTLSVPPGTYVVRVEVTGQQPSERTVTVAAAPATLDFVLLEDTSEVITIVGSRTPRSQLETTVPVDVISNEVIEEASQTETNQILNTLAPSFSATHLSISDGTDHIDPASLRGLGPEHVLVLINGRRLHQSSLINVYNGGTVGVDLNAIPTAAIARIEVLRDGAASQYGSDAIAGVINIVLKEDVDLVDLYSMTGITAENDGLQFKLGTNTGVSLGDKGFLNLTAELFSRGRTSRSEPWPDDIFPGITGREATDAELARRGLIREQFTMKVGQAGATVGTLFLNAGYELSENFKLHAHGGYTYRQGKASGYFRLPSQEARVDLRVYPNGFLPEINPVMQAWTATVGVEGKVGKWQGDLSLTHGGDNFRFRVENSLNASLGLDSPTDFDAGRLRFYQTNLNLDVVRPIELSQVKSLSVVAGGELRFDNYSIAAGQRESYELGPEVTSDGQPKAPGSQVFPGFQPSDESNEGRRNVAAYAGVESQLTDRINLDLGGRFENYSDFGSTVIGKAAARLAVIKQDDNELALRGAASTGFRAPGLQQLWYSTIFTQFVNDPDTGELSPSEILLSPNDSAVTRAFAVPALKEETSVNFSAGFTARLLGNLSFSADYYRISIDDRVVLSGLFDTGDAVLGEAITDIVDEFPGVVATQFFVNAVDTTTNGLDLVVDYTHRMREGVLKGSVAANFTSTEVDDVKVPESMQQRFGGIEGGAERVRQIFLGRYGENLLEDVRPRVKGTFGLRFDRGGFSSGARVNYFGPTEYNSDAGEELDEEFGAEVTLDVDLGYRIGRLWWSIGANNVLDNYPDQLKKADNRNSDSFLYSPSSVPAGAPYGIEGAFYYARLQYKY